MKGHSYHGRPSTASLAAGGILGILIAPSVPRFACAILREQNIAKLFAAATVPGILAMLGKRVVIAVFCKLSLELIPRNAAMPLAQRWQALLRIWPIVLIFIVVFCGIYGGLFSSTEGAAVGSVATFIAGLAQGKLDRAAMQRSFSGTAETTAMVFPSSWVTT